MHTQSADLPADRVGENDARALLAWFDQAQRSLPWRAPRGMRPDPFVVLVSELMLQQTRVEVVIPRFVEFMRAFPSVEALAEASEEAVRAQWSGLGYYRRARYLHGAAKKIRTLGGFPRTPQELRTLPGIGEYTAAAIASIAFGVCTPVLDGNVERVTARLLAETRSPKHAAPRRRLRSCAAALLEPGRPGDSNQALMELGATVCRPVAPRCADCPLAHGCAAVAAGNPEDYPTRAPRAPRRERQWLQAVCLREQHGATELLLERRGKSRAVLAGAWLLPELEPDAWTQLQAAANSSEAAEALGAFRHSITTTDYEVVLCRVPRHVAPWPGSREAETVDRSPAEGAGAGDATAGAADVSADVVAEPASYLWVRLDAFDDQGRWSGAEDLATSSMLAKAVRQIRRQHQQLVLG